MKYSRELLCNKHKDERAEERLPLGVRGASVPFSLLSGEESRWLLILWLRWLNLRASSRTDGNSCRGTVSMVSETLVCSVHTVTKTEKPIQIYKKNIHTFPEYFKITICMNISVQKVWGQYDFSTFFSPILYQSCTYLMKNTVKKRNIVKYY